MAITKIYKGTNDVTSSFLKAYKGSSEIFSQMSLKRLVLVGGLSDHSTVMTSDDGGITWVERTTPLTTGINGVAYSPNLNLYVAVGRDGKIITSPDAITWTQRTSGVTTSLYSVVWANNKFVACGAPGGTKLYNLYSTNGTTWTKTELYGGTAPHLYSVRWLNGQFIAVGGWSTGGGSAVFTSTNGSSWSKILYDSQNTSVLKDYTFADITFNGLVYVAVLRGNPITSPNMGMVAYSSNLSSWTIAKTGLTYPMAINYLNGFYYVTGGTTTGYVIYSSDLNTWTTKTLSSCQYPRPIIFENNKFFVPGYPGIINYSENGTTWTYKNTGKTTEFTDIIAGQEL